MVEVYKLKYFSPVAFAATAHTRREKPNGKLSPVPALATFPAAAAGGRKSHFRSNEIMVDDKSGTEHRKMTGELAVCHRRVGARHAASGAH